ncbi:MAG: hypothetical protein HKN92_11085 [Chitinophagales bacterium]|nr:hypothetical protein [Chitinophagales bacterium]
MRYILIIIFSSFVFFACQEQVRYCNENNVGELCFDNNTSDTAFIFIKNGIDFFIPPNFEICTFVPTGVAEYSTIVNDSTGPSDSLMIIDCQIVQIDL